MDSFLNITLDNLNLTSIKKGSSLNDFAIYNTTKYNTHIQFTKNLIAFEADNLSILEEALKNTKIEIINSNGNQSEKNSLLDYLLLYKTLTFINNTINLTDNIKIEFNKFKSMHHTIPSNYRFILLPKCGLKIVEKVRFTLFYTVGSNYEFYVQELNNKETKENRE